MLIRMSANPLSADDLDDVFAALANSTRRSILAALAQGEASVSQLAEPFDMSLPAISRHIKVLERAGLITQGQRAQYRPCTLNADALAAVRAWADECRSTWEASFDRLDNLLDDVQNTSKPRTKNQSKKEKPND